MRIPYDASKYHIEGWNAFFSNSSINPYKSFTQDYMEWNSGFKSAMEYSKTQQDERDMDESY